MLQLQVLKKKKQILRSCNVFSVHRQTVGYSEWMTLSLFQHVRLEHLLALPAPAH